LTLVVDGCSFSYSSQLVLDQISMQISKGEVVSIVGPNGSGKSTFLRCICRVLQPKGGVVYLNNQDVAI